MKLYWFHFDVDSVQSNRKTLRDLRELMLATTDDFCLWLVEYPPSTYPQGDLDDIAAAFNELSCRITAVGLKWLSFRILDQLVPTLTHLEQVSLCGETQVPQCVLSTLATHDSLKLLDVKTANCDVKAIIEELPRFTALERLELDCTTRPWPSKVFAIFVDFIEAQGLPPSLTRLSLKFKFHATGEADETMPLMTRLVRKISSTPVSLHLRLRCWASIYWSADGSLFRNFMSAVQAARNTELDILHDGGDVPKDLMLAAQQYGGIRRLVLEEPQLQELLEFLPKARVVKLSLWGLALESTKARDEMVQAMLQNGTIQEVEVCNKVLPCKHIFKRNKLLATVVNSGMSPPGVSAMPLALYRLLRTDLGATPAYALLRAGHHNASISAFHRRQARSNFTSCTSTTILQKATATTPS